MICLTIVILLSLHSPHIHWQSHVLVAMMRLLQRLRGVVVRQLDRLPVSLSRCPRHLRRHVSVLCRHRGHGIWGRIRLIGLLLTIRSRRWNVAGRRFRGVGPGDGAARDVVDGKMMSVLRLLLLGKGVLALLARILRGKRNSRRRGAWVVLLETRHGARASGNNANSAMER